MPRPHTRPRKGRECAQPPAHRVGKAAAICSPTSISPVPTRANYRVNHCARGSAGETGGDTGEERLGLSSPAGPRLAETGPGSGRRSCSVPFSSYPTPRAQATDFSTVLDSSQMENWRTSSTQLHPFPHAPPTLQASVSPSARF